MAITFIQQKKRQQLLILALGLVALITSAILWQGFFKVPPPPEEEVQVPVKKVEIDYDFLQSDLLKELGKPLPAVQIPETIGRENPFVEP